MPSTDSFFALTAHVSRELIDCGRLTCILSLVLPYRKPLAVAPGRPESQLLAEFKEMMSQNKVFR